MYRLQILTFHQYPVSEAHGQTLGLGEWRHRSHIINAAVPDHF
jgi:hypothetical protein